MKTDFPVFQRKINGRELVYLDSAATTQKPMQVISSISEFYKNSFSNVHRANYNLAQEATDLYEETRKKVAEFISADVNEIVFTKNATESMNLIANTLTFQKKDEIIISEMEHHSNLVLWQQLAKKKDLVLRIVKVKNRELDLEDLKSKLTDKSKVVSLCHVSNVLSTVNPIKEIRKIAKDKILIVDGSQAVSHINIDVKKLDCDFYVFSSHKMFGPSGVGVLYGKRELLEKINPFLYGGEMISDVSFNETKYNQVPYKFEAGTPNIEGVIGLGAAIDYIQTLGVKNIQRKEQELKEYALKKLKELPGIKIYSNEKGIGIITFNLFNEKIIHGHDVSYLLNDKGICVRSGYLCAQPLIQEVFESPGVVRISFHIYNEKEDIDKLIIELKKIIKRFS